jgi:hypothetical protein
VWGPLPRPSALQMKGPAAGSWCQGLRFIALASAQIILALLLGSTCRIAPVRRLLCAKPLLSSVLYSHQGCVGRSQLRLRLASGMFLPLCPEPGQGLCALEKSRLETEVGVLHHHLYLSIGRMRGVDQQVALLRLNGRRNPKAQGGARFEPVQPNGLRVAFV